MKNLVPLDQGVTPPAAASRAIDPAIQTLKTAWLKKKAELFAGKLTKPDSQDPEAVNHLNWYLSTAFKRPYPGESKVRPPSDFNNPAPIKADEDE